MKKLILSLLFLLSLTCADATYNSADWVECDTLHVAAHSPLQERVIFLNSYTGQGVNPNTWIDVDLSDILPSTAKAAFLNGIMIITHGTTVETADLHFHLRAKGETEDVTYCGQTIEAAIGNGQRSTAAYWVPLDENQVFQFKYWHPNSGASYPSYSAYGLNFNVGAWAE